MERVQLNLERLLPELRDLEKKKIFTRVGSTSRLYARKASTLLKLSSPLTERD